MNKRQKFAIATVFLLVAMLASRAGIGQFCPWRVRAVLFVLLSLVAAIWALRDEDFSGIEWVTLPILPVMFAVAAFLTLPLLPAGFDRFLLWGLSSDSGALLAFLVRILFLLFFASGFYAALLTSNIFNVAALRNIQLLRVAHSFGLLLSVVAALLSFLVIFSLHLSSFQNFVLTLSAAGLLALPPIWSTLLEKAVGERTRGAVLATALVLAEAAWVLSFWPLGAPIIALFLSALFYTTVSFWQYHFSERLNGRVVREFLLMMIGVCFLTFLAANWGG